MLIVPLDGLEGAAAAGKRDGSVSVIVSVIVTLVSVSVHCSSHKTQGNIIIMMK